MTPETMPPCPLHIPAETLSAWRNDLLETRRAEQISQHLRTCLACQQQMREFDHIAALLRRQRQLDPGTRVWQGVLGRLDQRGGVPAQRSQSRNGLIIRPDFRQERIHPMKVISRTGHRWSARAMTLVAALLLVALVGGLTLGLLLGHRADTGIPVGPPTHHTGAIHEFALPPTCDGSCHPSGITRGPDGNLWFTEGDGNQIGRITPAGRIEEYALPATCGGKTCDPLGITRGPDGNLWFTEGDGNQIGRITPAGQIQEYALPTTCGGKSCDPFGITRGPDGNLWFTEANGNKIGRITPAGQIQEFALPSTTCSAPSTPLGCGPFGITSGPDGHLWFAGAGGGNTIGRMTLSGSVQEFTLPSTCGGGCQAYAITSGPDGNLWFTEYVGNRIGRITPAGQIQEFALLTCGAACDPTSITSGPDGNLWFTEYGGNHIGRITPAGQIQEFALPTTCGGTGCSPDGITSGPDGNLWFTAYLGNQIGRISP